LSSDKAGGLDSDYGNWDKKQPVLESFCLLFARCAALTNAGFPAWGKWKCH